MANNPILNAFRGISSFMDSDDKKQIRKRELITIENSKKKEQKEAKEPERTARQTIDTSADIVVMRNIKYLEDGGDTVGNIIRRLEAGQTVITDFQGVSESIKTRIFDVLYGATIAYHGNYVRLDNDNAIFMFTSNENKISEFGVMEEKG